MGRPRIADRWVEGSSVRTEKLSGGKRDTSRKSERQRLSGPTRGGGDSKEKRE